jgi:hypothetical protein
MVTGRDDTTRRGAQAETDATTSFSRGVHRVVVGFNDDTGQSEIEYGPTSRKVLRGASLMGWSYSEDRGTTWIYGGRLKPPPGWAVLWGDPALTTSKTSYSLVFMSSLAIPDGKFPASGISGYLDDGQLGGACIARSTDGGVRFEHFQCLTNTTPRNPVWGLPTRGNFYDGGSMAAGPNGEIFAAYVDIDRSQIDVWRSPDGRQPFVLLPPPFPHYYVGSHPRIRVAADGTLYAMAVAKTEKDNDQEPHALIGSRYRNGAWEEPRTILWRVALYPQVKLGGVVLGAPLNLRTGPQFSFDVGAASFEPPEEDQNEGIVRRDSVRWLVTQQDEQGWLFLRGGVCDETLRSCGWYEKWTFGALASGRRTRLDVFNPNVTAFQGLLFGASPRWQASFLVREGSNTTTLGLTRSTLGYVNGTPLSIPVDIARAVPVCPDQRPLGEGYWGDYDGFLPVDVDGDQVRFLRFMTNSSLGCTKRWSFYAEHQHVQAVSYWY